LVAARWWLAAAKSVHGKSRGLMMLGSKRTGWCGKWKVHSVASLEAKGRVVEWTKQFSTNI
jgi:hypothetical protein